VAPRRVAPLVLILVAALLAGGCAVSRPPRARPGAHQQGVASWYGPGFHGRATASGEAYDMHALTAAHPSLPLGTWVEVRNLDNGKSVTVRINDRGPHVKRRVIDLSYAAAERLEMIAPGTAPVEIVVLALDEALPASGYTVQVGAFRDPERARALCEELRPTFPEAAVNGDGTWHRVQIGEFPRRRQAEELRRELRRLGLAALVVALR
jgi:rare lipoprotein A